MAAATGLQEEQLPLHGHVGEETCSDCEGELSDTDEEDGGIALGSMAGDDYWTKRCEELPVDFECELTTDTELAKVPARVGELHHTQTELPRQTSQTRCSSTGLDGACDAFVVPDGLVLVRRLSRPPAAPLAKQRGKRRRWKDVTSYMLEDFNFMRRLG